MSLADVVSDMVTRKTAETVATALVGAVVREAASRIGPDKVGLARTLVDSALDVVPVEVLRQMLDDAAVRRANAIADAAEDAKHGP
jgi:hypothetical protein